MKIAFLGLGAMGYPMAKHLTTGNEVLVWNRSPEMARRHAAEFGTSVAGDITDCASADVIITILPTSVEVDEVVDALWAGLREGTLWIDATSGDPVHSRKTAARLSEKRLAFVDAPVTGGTPGAERGTLTVMVGGSEEDFRRTESVVSSYAGKIVHVGPVGSGHAIKAINNAMLAANTLAAAEGLLTARRFGIDIATALEVINSGSGRSNASENLLPSRLIGGDWPVTFKLGLHDKDVRIAASMAHSQHVSAPITALTSQLYTAALNELGPNADYVEVVKYAARMSGEEW